MASSNTTSSSSVAHAASSGFSKGDFYDQHRPSYTANAVDTLLEKLRVRGKKHAKTLDLAAGTGKFTEALAAREEDFDIVAVEPLESMREVLTAKKLKGVRVEAGKADAIPLDDGSVDAVICAQSFHWFADKSSLREIHRVLHRHGALGMVWNVEHYNAPRDHTAATKWEGKLHELVLTSRDSSTDNSFRYRDAEWAKIFDDQVKTTPLSLLVASDDQMFSLPLAQEWQQWEVRLTREQIWERLCTLSHIAVLEGEQRESVHKRVNEVLSSPDVEEDQDGKVVVHGYSHLVWTSVIPSDGRPNLTEVETPGT